MRLGKTWLSWKRVSGCVCQVLWFHGFTPFILNTTDTSTGDIKPAYEARNGNVYMVDGGNESREGHYTTRNTAGDESDANAPTFTSGKQSDFDRSRSENSGN
jgi:hypothetical protein